MTRYSYPHTIDNGSGERLIFLRRVSSAHGERLEVENVVQPGAGPPMHVHHLQEEALTVQQGRIGYQRPGQPAQYGGPGDTVAFAAGDAHRFWNAGDDELRCTGHIAPPGNVEYLLTELYASVRRTGKGRPDPFDIAFLMSRYRSEFGMTEMPAAVQSILFPVLLTIGRLMGRYRRYADAPEAVG